LTASQVERRGLEVETKDITNTLVEPIDPVTGNKMPARAVIPDPGFSHNPGEAYFKGLGDTLAERAGTWKKEIAHAVLTEMISAPEFKEFLERPSGKFPIARTADDTVLVVREEELKDALGGVSPEDIKEIQATAKELTGKPKTMRLQDGREVSLGDAGDELVVVRLKTAGTGYTIPGPPKVQ